ncbi:LysR family transcriptional regulator [Asanoa sp. NPDC049573]|uniref:LysR family transcriptional regulator n=1 Tax=Asanoa sp. NPDC049573 TaxID=3155396 RepID=UPI003425357F
MLDARKLRLLRDLAAAGTIAAAAERAGCTAAAASQQLKALEREVGVALLERSPRSVRLTEAGLVLAERSHRVLAELAEAERAARDAAELSGGCLRVAAYATSATFVVPALAAFRRQHPGVRLSFSELEPEDALPALRAGTVDLAVTSQYTPLTRPDLNALSQRPLARERLFLAVPPRLRPAQPTGARLVDYAAEAWIATRTDAQFQAMTELACRAAGFEPDITSRVDSTAVTLHLVAADLGVAMLPAPASVPRAVTLLPIERPARLFREVYATTRAADRSPALLAFHQLLLRQLARTSDRRSGVSAVRRRRDGGPST